MVRDGRCATRCWPRWPRGRDLRDAARRARRPLRPRSCRGGAAQHAALVAQATADPRYRAENNRAVPRKIGSRLWLFDCINCDKCMPVCPNDANFVYETGAADAPTTSSYVVRGGARGRAAGGRLRGAKAHQIANFQDFCNECGNCDVVLPGGRRPLHREAALLRLARGLARAARARRLLRACGRATCDAVWARIRGRRVPPRGGPAAATAALFTRRRDHGGGPAQRARRPLAAARARRRGRGPHPRLLRLPEHGPGRGRRARAGAPTR